MSKFVKALDDQINIDKEVIQVAPKSGIKQIKNLRDTIEKTIDKYSKMDEAILNEMTERYNKITSIVQNEEIDNVEKNLLELDGLTLSDDIQTSFQKMQLDKLLYNINGYYKKNLGIINRDICECVNKFREVGIPVTKKDFNISEYVTEYMSVLLDEASKGNINSEKVKSAFDKVYWKCSDIIPHIVVNIRKIYDDNENNINKYYKNKTEEILNSLNLTKEQICHKKKELVRRLDDLSKVDGRLLLDSFLNNKYSIGDYTNENYLNIYEKLTSKELKTLSEYEKADMDENIEKFYNNLVEYVNFTEFRFLIDEILNLKEEKQKELDQESDNKKDNKKKNKKTESENLQDEIKKITNEIYKLNDSLGGQKRKFSLFAKKEDKTEDKAKILERDNKILNLKELYAKFDDSRLKDAIIYYINDTSKLLEVLKLASYDYGFVARCIIKKNTDILEPEIYAMIDRIRTFVRLYDFSVINHINITEKKDISIVIKDKYKLLGMNLSKENFLESNIEELLKDAQITNVYRNIEKSNIPIEDIRFVMKAKDILKR